MSRTNWLVDDVVFKRSDFFSRLCLRAFREFAYVIDDYAIVVSATKLMIETGVSPHRAHTLASSLTLLHKAGIFVSANDTLAARHPLLAEIERDMLVKKRVTHEAALVLTLHWLKDQDSLPTIFGLVDEVAFDSVFDFSECELQILLRLAELSLPLRFRLPLDAKDRGLLVPIQDLLSKLEVRSSDLPITIEVHDVDVSPPVAPFFEAVFEKGATVSDAPVEVSMMPDFDSQASLVCEHIKNIQEQDAGATIAVAFRSLDSRVRWFEEAFSRRNLAYRITASLPLSELPQVKAVLHTLKAQSESESLHKSLAEYLSLFREDSTLSALINYFSQHLRDCSGSLSVLSFYHWLTGLLQRREVSFSAGSVADCVEIVSVKQLWSRTYDYVFVVDMAQGRFPKTQASSENFSEKERVEINQILGAHVLASASAQQTWDALWFVGAISSAQRGLFLLSSLTDPKGREQAPSEFLSAAGRVVGVRTEVPLEPTCNVTHQHNSEQQPYRLDANAAKEVFGRWLGLSREHPLTPTRLEAFALCPFRALVQRIFGIEEPQESADDLDHLETGRFAHAVLESFFSRFSNEDLNEQGLSAFGRARLKSIVDSKRDSLQRSEKVVEAQLLWLALIIERAISNMVKEPGFANVKPSLFEYRIGFKENALRFDVGDEKIFLGGIVDRIDEGERQVAIVDYKMSSAQALKQKVSDKEVLTTHFQLPLYTRLLLETYPTWRDKEVLAYLISIRDGACISMKADLKERVLDDAREDGLKAAVAKVMQPLLQGVFEAKANDSCSSCYLKAACRV